MALSARKKKRVLAVGPLKHEGANITVAVSSAVIFQKKLPQKITIKGQSVQILSLCELLDTLLSTRTLGLFLVKCQRAPSRPSVKIGPKAQRLTDNA